MPEYHDEVRYAAVTVRNEISNLTDHVVESPGLLSEENAAMIRAAAADLLTLAQEFEA